MKILCTELLFTSFVLFCSSIYSILISLHSVLQYASNELLANRISVIIIIMRIPCPVTMIDRLL